MQCSVGCEFPIDTIDVRRGKRRWGDGKMVWEKVVKWLGMICILAGVSRMGMTPTALLWGTDSVPELSFGFIACILMSVGTIATYLVQSRETGVIGFITVLAITVANIVTTCMLWTILVLGTVPEVEGVFLTISRMGMLALFTLGTLVFTILTYRAKVFPRWVVVLHVIMMVSFVLPEWFAFFWGLAYVGMGYCIWTAKFLDQSTMKTSSKAS